MSFVQTRNRLGITQFWALLRETGSHQQIFQKKVLTTRRCLRESEVRLALPPRSPRKVAMKIPYSILIALVLFVVAGVQAQSSRSIDPISRPRLVAGSTTTSPSSSKVQGQSTQQQTPARPAGTEDKSADKLPATTRPQPEESGSSSGEESSVSLRRLSPNRIRSRINEAERLMKVLPVPTAMTPPSLDY